MRSTAVVIFILTVLQGCLVWQTTSASPETSDFERWRSSYDFDSNPGVRASPECDGRPDGFYPINGQCRPEYYACIGGTKYDLICPLENGQQSVFDPATGKCVASCPVSTTKSPFSCSQDGFFPLGTTCSASWYACVDGQFYPQTCPDGTVFDPATGSCQKYEVASCTKTTTAGTGPTAPANPSSTITPALTTTPSSSSTASPSTTDLATDSTTTTPSTTTTTPSTTTTTTPSTTTTTTPSTTTTPKPFVCPARDVYAIPGECSGNYYSCGAAGAAPQILQCPNPTLNFFDCVQKACTPKAQAYCTINGVGSCPSEGSKLLRLSDPYAILRSVDSQPRPASKSELSWWSTLFKWFSR